jgi:hypothetical protein
MHTTSRHRSNTCPRSGYTGPKEIADKPILGHKAAVRRVKAIKFIRRDFKIAVVVPQMFLVERVVKTDYVVAAGPEEVSFDVAPRVSRTLRGSVDQLPGPQEIDHHPRVVKHVILIPATGQCAPTMVIFCGLQSKNV